MMKLERWEPEEIHVIVDHVIFSPNADNQFSKVNCRVVCLPSDYITPDSGQGCVKACAVTPIGHPEVWNQLFH